MQALICVGRHSTTTISKMTKMQNNKVKIFETTFVAIIGMHVTIHKQNSLEAIPEKNRKY